MLIPVHLDVGRTAGYVSRYKIDFKLLIHDGGKIALDVVEPRFPVSRGIEFKFV